MKPAKKIVPTNEKKESFFGIHNSTTKGSQPNMEKCFHIPIIPLPPPSSSASIIQEVEEKINFSLSMARTILYVDFLCAHESLVCLSVVRFDKEKGGKCIVTTLIIKFVHFISLTHYKVTWGQGEENETFKLFFFFMYSTYARDNVDERGSNEG